MGTCILTIEGKRVLVAHGAPPLAEYLLFGPNEIELRAAAGSVGHIEEVGYETSVQKARERLQEAGVKPDQVAECLARVREAAHLYARGPVVLSNIDSLADFQLLATDSFDGGARSYQGSYLDLHGLLADLQSKDDEVHLQATYLAAILALAEPTAHVRLSTISLSQIRPPGFRSQQRVRIRSIDSLADRILQATKGKHSKPSPRIALTRAAFAERLARDENLCGHNQEIQTALGDLRERVLFRGPPESGPLGESEVYEVERLIDEARFVDALPALDALESRLGRSPATTYLRARTALLTGSEPARAIAERIGDLALSMTSFPELGLLAAEAWRAANDLARAEPFARDVIENPHASLAAFERALAVIEPDALFKNSLEVIEHETPVMPKVSYSPPQVRDSLPPVVTDPIANPVMSEPKIDSRRAPYEPTQSMSSLAISFVRGASLPPPPMPEMSFGPSGATAESAESLSWPFGSPPPPMSDLPNTPELARTLFTKWTRDLGRDFREALGYELRLDLDGVEALQAYLVETLPGAVVRTPGEAREVRRAGAYLSEVLARSAGAVWAEMASTELGHWSMAVSGQTPLFPFGRVLRFIKMRHRERDLVSYVIQATLVVDLSSH